MPLSAVITEAIPQQNFEAIRDRIAEILTAELAAQWALDNTIPKVKQVYTDRSIAIDADREVPCINVCVAPLKWVRETMVNADGEYEYYIDIYTSANSSASERGDSKAMLKMTRLAGLVRAILKAPHYATLAFERGTIGGVNVTGFMPLYKGVHDDARDALSNVVGRIVVNVRSAEQNIITDTAVPLLNHTTKVYRENSEYGQRYVWSIVLSLPVSGGSSFTLPAEYSGYDVALVNDDSQSYNRSNFTQAGDTITMDGISFTPGQIEVTLEDAEYSTDIVTTAAGNSLTLPASLANKTVALVDDGQQSYRSSEFTRNGMVITFTNGNTYPSGHRFTVVYGNAIANVTVLENGISFNIPEANSDYDLALINDTAQSYRGNSFTRSDLLVSITNGNSYEPGTTLTAIFR